MGKSRYYWYLAFVIVVWGAFPVLITYFYRFMSASVYTTLSALISAVAFTLMAWKKLRQMNRRYLLTAGITGLCYSLATILQLVGLQYTTPSMYAFLENTSCVIVPFLLMLLVKKRPGALTITASLVCLVGCFILSGADTGGGFGIGEILCGLAGVLFSGNIVGTGLYARDLDTNLYLMVQKWIHVAVSAVVMVAMHLWMVNGAPLERMWFDWQPGLLALLTVFAFVSSCVCWILRTKAVIYLDMSFVSVAMPLAAVFTMVLSVVIGTDVMSAGLIGGAAIITAALVLSAFAGILEDRKTRNS